MVSDLTKGSPARVIFYFSLPIILGNVFQQVYNFVDTVIVGRFVSYQALAGVGVTTGMVFLIFGFILGINSGLGIRTAQAYGAGDMGEVRRSIGTSILISAAMSILLTVVSLLLANPLLHLAGTSEEIFPHARDYVTVIYAGICTQAAYNLIACILRALGDSKTPLYFLIFSSILNICLDLLFVKTFGWGVKGAALATVISQLTSAVLCFIFAFVKYREIRLHKEDFKTSWEFIWEHLRIGFPMAFQFSVTAVGMVFLNAALNGFPAPYIAGFSAASKVSSLGSLVPVSLGVAMANYAGQNYGAGRMDRMRQGVRASLIMSLSVCVVVSTIIVVFAHPITSLFVDAPSAENAADIFDASRRYLKQRPSGHRKDLLAADGGILGTFPEVNHIVHPAKAVRLHRCHPC